MFPYHWHCSVQHHASHYGWANDNLHFLFEIFSSHLLDGSTIRLESFSVGHNVYRALWSNWGWGGSCISISTPMPCSEGFWPNRHSPKYCTPKGAMCQPRQHPGAPPLTGRPLPPSLPPSHPRGGAPWPAPQASLGLASRVSEWRGVTCVGKAKGKLEVHGREWMGKTQSEPTLGALGGVRVLTGKITKIMFVTNWLITNDVTKRSFSDRRIYVRFSSFRSTYEIRSCRDENDHGGFVVLVYWQVGDSWW